MFLHNAREFRQAAYECLCRAKDATFELKDAILLTRNAYSLADLSMCPIFRRQWSSIYEAIQDTRPQRHKLMRLYSQKIPKQRRIIVAGDHTTWSRPDAPTLRERTYEHYNQGGLLWSSHHTWIRIQYHRLDTRNWRQLGITTLDMNELQGAENPIDKAVWQLKQVCQYLWSRPITCLGHRIWMCAICHQNCGH